MARHPRRDDTDSRAPAHHPNDPNEVRAMMIRQALTLPEDERVALLRLVDRALKRLRR